MPQFFLAQAKSGAQVQQSPIETQPATPPTKTDGWDGALKVPPQYTLTGLAILLTLGIVGYFTKNTFDDLRKTIEKLSSVDTDLKLLQKDVTNGFNDIKKDVTNGFADIKKDISTLSDSSKRDYEDLKKDLKYQTDDIKRDVDHKTGDIRKDIEYKAGEIRNDLASNSKKLDQLDGDLKSASSELKAEIGKTTDALSRKIVDEAAQLADRLTVDFTDRIDNVEANQEEIEDVVDELVTIELLMSQNGIIIDGVKDTSLSTPELMREVQKLVDHRIKPMTALRSKVGKVVIRYPRKGKR